MCSLAASQVWERVVTTSKLRWLTHVWAKLITKTLKLFLAGQVHDKWWFIQVETFFMHSTVVLQESQISRTCVIPSQPELLNVLRISSIHTSYNSDNSFTAHTHYTMLNYLLSLCNIQLAGICMSIQLNCCFIIKLQHMVYIAFKSAVNHISYPMTIEVYYSFYQGRLTQHL